MSNLAGRTAAVTGGGRGIGAAICRRLARDGAQVLVVDRDLAPAAAVAQEVGGEALRLDVSQPADVAAALADRAVDVLVNNAGYDSFAWFTDVTPAQWRQLLAVNLEGVFACTQAVLPYMQQQRFGRIINISSEAGRIGSKGNAVYAAAKGGVIAFTKSIARENARFAITANVVLPGPVDTPLLDEIRAMGAPGEKMIAAMKAGTQLGRLASVDEIAPAVAFLASDDASYITAEAWGVSGGMGITG